MRPPRGRSTRHVLNKVRGRARNLERRFIDDGSIRFDNDNEGGWLWVVTKDSTDIDYGELGMGLVDRSGQGIFLISVDPDDAGIFSSILVTPTAVEITGSLVFDGGGP